MYVVGPKLDHSSYALDLSSSSVVTLLLKISLPHQISGGEHDDIELEIDNSNLAGKKVLFEMNGEESLTLYDADLLNLAISVEQDSTSVGQFQQFSVKASSVRFRGISHEVYIDLVYEPSWVGSMVQPRR